MRGLLAFAAACVLSSGSVLADWAWTTNLVTGEPLAYRIVGGYAVVGDIIIGRHEEVQAHGYLPLKPLPRARPMSVEKGASARFDRPCEDTLINTIFGIINYQACVTTWDFAVVPYVIGPGLEAARPRIEQAFELFHRYTAVRFVPYSGQQNWVVFQAAAAPIQGCLGQSQLGRARRPGSQVVLLATLDGVSGFEKCDASLIMHELMHALGYGHEHQRPDRDQWIEYHPGNVERAEYLGQFTVDALVPNTPYDYLSLMHYPATAFAKPNKLTLVPKDPRFLDVIGRGDLFSPSDLVAIDAHYGPPHPEPVFNLPAALKVGLDFLQPAPAAAGPASGPSYQGLWWNAPAESERGWGLGIAHQGDTLFGTWFTYDASGRPTWLVMPALQRVAQGRYSGQVFRATGPAFNGATWDSSRFSTSPAGSATLSFSDAASGVFSYTLTSGATTVSRAKPIVRQVFSQPVPTCIVGDPTPSPASYQDLWWAAPAGSEDGWGISIAHQGDVLFAVWFTYDVDATPLWFVASNAVRTGISQFAGEVYRTTGPSFAASTWDPTQVAAAPVGSATFSFSGPSQGTFTHSVGGTPRTKPITRQVFSNPQTACR